MKKKTLTALFIYLAIAMLLPGCGKSTGTSDSSQKDSQEKAEDNTDENTEENTGENDVKDEAEPEPEKDASDLTSGKKSLAQRMAGKYSFHHSDEDGNEEFYIMEVVPFGDNLYAFCGQAMPEDYESLEAYTFWASEFIPYDADEMRSTEGDKVTVNELRFSVMSNAGKYWDTGHKGTVTLTDDGLVFEGFDQEGFLVPDNDDSRLFLKDDRVEDAFGYLKHKTDGGDEKLQGLWILDDKEAGLYLEFNGSDLYVYKKDPNTEVFYAAGGCEYSEGSFECTASRLGYGGQPNELSCDYKVTDDTLSLKIKDTDFAEVIPDSASYFRVKDGSVPVVTMDEVKLDSESLGMFGGNADTYELTSKEHYGVFVSSARALENLESVMDKLEEAGFMESCIVYTPDLSGLNPEPYYVAAAGLYSTKSRAEEVLSKVQAAGFKDAYVKNAGSYTGDKFWYTANGSETIEVLSDGVMLRNVSLTIPYSVEGDALKADLLVPKDAVFDESADTGSFGNYEKGDTPYEWIVRNYDLMNEDTDQYLMYGPALSGVFEVGIKDNKITKYYGSYWWD
ncbi:MAG: SPOR domain-containing protein [Lachnospiraceae bacterium]|nr:SPOR domain-containing protein [Lachnospiraceae bacterium]